MSYVRSFELVRMIPLSTMRLLCLTADLLEPENHMFLNANGLYDCIQYRRMPEHSIDIELTVYEQFGLKLLRYERSVYPSGLPHAQFFALRLPLVGTTGVETYRRKCRDSGGKYPA